MGVHQQVFISYQRTDSEFAIRVREHLVNAGIRTWMDQFDIPVGAYWPDEIDRGLGASDIIVGILSPDAVESRNVKNEWDWAIQNDKRLLMIQVQTCVVPHRYVSINYIDATGPDATQALLSLLRTLGVHTSTPAATSQGSRIKRPQTRYTLSGDVNIAYQVIGDGPFDLVYVPGFVSNIDQNWELPVFANFFGRLASFSRLIMLDKRGTGLSDRFAGAPSLEQRMDDVRAVMDAVGSKRAALVGLSEGVPMCLLFAATYPERTIALALFGGYARRGWAPDYPIGRTDAELEELVAVMQRDWGGPVGPEFWAPSVADDEVFLEQWATYLRLAASPGAAIALQRLNHDIDVRHVLPAIRVPTLILHRSGDLVAPIENARYMAERIPGARFIELDGDDHIPMVGDTEQGLGTIESFLTDPKLHSETGQIPDSVLGTILALEYSGAVDRLQYVRQRTATIIGDFRGRCLTNVTGDRDMATFDGPARAIRCATAMLDLARQQKIDARAGLHTGEIELDNGSANGVPVLIAAALASGAEVDEIIVTSTVTDLVAGSGIGFLERSSQLMPDMPNAWRRFAVDRTTV